MTDKVDYLASAKAHISQINGIHPTDYIKTYALLTIAYALIAIAEKVVNE